MIPKIRRPLVRYHGGKWRIAPWIISQMPFHRVYVEAFGGGGSVLLRKPRAYAEIYNDLDEEMVSLFRIVREHGDEIKRSIELTPFSRLEFLAAWEPSEDPIEQARRTLIRSFMGFGSAAITKLRVSETNRRGGLATTGFRSNSNRSNTTPAHDWRNLPQNLPAIIERLRGVVIECRDAIEVMAAHDQPHTLHYVDPPYVSSTRDAGGDYRFEMTDEQHVILGKFLRGCSGMVLVSGYPCALYEDIYEGWTRIERQSLADGARARTEVLWMNDQCRFMEKLSLDFEAVSA